MADDLIPDATIATINAVRDTFLEAIRRLPEVPSFATLCQTSTDFGAEFERLCRVADRRHVREACDGRITTAVIGSSGHGKTTVLDEMFPGLSQRGWLETDVTDTTSQALRVAHADPGSAHADRVRVHGWTVAQVKQLMSSSEVAEQNANDAIEVTYHDDAVVVDGTHTTLDPRDLAEWRYARRVELRPFDTPYEVTDAQQRDRKWIRSLTVKEQSSVLEADRAVFEHEGRSYDALQLRALVESVGLHDGFDEVLRWARTHPAGERAVEQMRRTTFVDTPGLATGSVAKDEVLRHFLGRKSNQIALELLREDRLDIVVHLVLCGQKSQFDRLWIEIERECGRAETEGLADRTILAVNGTNLYFTNPDIRAKYTDPQTTLREGDHFAATLEDNILQRLSPRGRARPARICFLDSRRIVDAFGDYDEFYARHRKTMEEWAEPGGVGHDTLARLGCLEGFRDNIDALADPDDRGQGHLVRCLLDLIAEQGESILVRKHLIRTGLVEALDSLHEMLGRFYSGDGALDVAAAREALGRCLAFLDRRDPSAIDTFVRAQVDPYLDGLVPAEDDDAPDDWAAESFRRTAEMVKEAVFEKNGDAGHRIPAAIQHEFARYFDDRVTGWTERWGYTRVDWPPPPDSAVGTRELLLHTLRIHAREMLFQLADSDEIADGAAGGGGMQQSEQDRAGIATVLRALEDAVAAGTRLTARAAGGAATPRTAEAAR